MREGHFIQQNKSRWTGYEAATSDPDEMARRFTYLVDDLAYAKTYYPHGNTAKYLNNLAANIYLSIYRNRKDKGNRIFSFWTTELPLIMYRHRKLLFFAFLFFAAFTAIGVFSAWLDPKFVRAILGNSYVDMTETNIANGDPFGVYKHENDVSMFAFIAYNNITVALYTFLLGIFASVGTLWYMLRTGLMLGVFEYLFFHHNLGFKSILVVFCHGTLEISAIVIAGMAGMVLGNSILFPGTFTRRQSLVAGAKDGIKIIFGLVPVFIIAAFFETFVTRFTNLPVLVSLVILLVSLSFVLLYFVIYPAVLVRRRIQAHSYDPLAAD